MKQADGAPLQTLALQTGDTAPHCGAFLRPVGRRQAARSVHVRHGVMRCLHDRPACLTDRSKGAS